MNAHRDHCAPCTSGCPCPYPQFPSSPNCTPGDRPFKIGKAFRPVSGRGRFRSPPTSSCSVKKRVSQTSGFAWGIDARRPEAIAITPAIDANRRSRARPPNPPFAQTVRGLFQRFGCASPHSIRPMPRPGSRLRCLREIPLPLCPTCRRVFMKSAIVGFANGCAIPGSMALPRAREMRCDRHGPCMAGRCRFLIPCSHLRIFISVSAFTPHSKKDIFPRANPIAYERRFPVMSLPAKTLAKSLANGGSMPPADVLRFGEDTSTCAAALTFLCAPPRRQVRSVRSITPPRAGAKNHLSRRRGRKIRRQMR